MLGRLRSFGTCARGQSLVELAISLPILILVFLGMVEFSYAYDLVHGMGSIGREAANIASRGGTLVEARGVALTNGSDLGIGTRGGVVVSRIEFGGGLPTVMEQVTAGGYTSRLGDLNQSVSRLGSAGYLQGTEVYAVELFLRYEPITPVGRWLEPLIPDVLYERAVF